MVEMPLNPSPYPRSPPISKHPIKRPGFLPSPWGRLPNFNSCSCETVSHTGAKNTATPVGYGERERERDGAARRKEVREMKGQKIAHLPIGMTDHRERAKHKSGLKSPNLFGSTAQYPAPHPKQQAFLHSLSLSLSSGFWGQEPFLPSN